MGEDAARPFEFASGRDVESVNALRCFQCTSDMLRQVTKGVESECPDGPKDRALGIGVLHGAANQN